MKLSRFSLFTLLAVVAATLSSCLGDGEFRETATYNYTDCFNVVTDLTTGQSEVRLSPTYQFEMNLTERTANINMSNISLPGVTGALSFKLENIKFTFDNRGNYIIQGTNLKPTGSAGSYYTFSNVSIKFIDRLLEEGGKRIPAYYVNFTLNGTTRVNAVGTVNYYFGKTEVNPKDNGEPYETDLTYYIVSLDPQSNQANIDFRNARYSDKMPVSLNFSLKNLPFTVNPDGYKIEKAGDMVPLVNDLTPNPDFKITDLIVDAITYKGADVTFDCNPMGMGDYKVSAQLEWLVRRLTPEQ